ncbi:GNAT family N-acetyltransferase [Streptomyces hygroscopicus]|uniref:GNAT family N-acetyltransferase n=1 Tax=Streptomyces hygroscopicus TaxID=1912 RepID=UPI00083137DC|nr:GNAT family N-acetyltransferase [Streptomyces hygroscopicus]GLV75972.1 hypothetical protein Shyhy02_39720 [Streptomyces hygroscopicus subsp. hygroscopicus]
MDWDEERLLSLEVDANYGLAPNSGGLPALLKDPTVLAVCAWSPGARLLALGSGIAHRARMNGWDQAYSPGRPPDGLVRLAESLDGQAVSVEGGPCFVFPPHLAAPDPAPLPLIVSTADGKIAAQELVRPDNWQPGEWSELINGRFGEWAMAVYDNQPVSICHTPASNSTAAEAGIWTRADFRGRGLASAVVAAWSQRECRNKDVLFYSTTATNHASQSVARGLRLIPLGWLWTARWS